MSHPSHPIPIPGPVEAFDTLTDAMFRVLVIKDSNPELSEEAIRAIDHHLDRAQSAFEDLYAADAVAEIRDCLEATYGASS